MPSGIVIVKHQQGPSSLTEQRLSIWQNGQFIFTHLEDCIFHAKKIPAEAGILLAINKRLFKTTYQPVISLRPAPMSAKERTVFTPASSRAANFSSAVPLPPEMIAPA